MDTTWFAIDSIGQVAYFETGENGHAPAGPDTDVREELWKLLKPADSTVDQFWDLDNEGWLFSIGLYRYGYDEDYDPISPYHLQEAPETPLHIDQLPPDLRDRLREMTFDVHFGEAIEIQPLEFVRCVYWYDERIAFLCADGKTIKPIQGMEDRFADFVRDFKQSSPEAAKNLIFDGPTE
jgi:hypothetical protein